MGRGSKRNVFDVSVSIRIILFPVEHPDNGTGEKSGLWNLIQIASCDQLLQLELISSLRAKAALTRSCVLRPSLQQHDRQARRPSDRIGSHVHRAGGHIQEAVQEARDRGPGSGTLCVLTRSNKHTQTDFTLHLVKHCLHTELFNPALAEDYWETCKPAKSKKSKAAAPAKESKPSKAAKPEPKAKAKAKAKAAAKDGKKEEKPKPKAKAAPKPETKTDDKATSAFIMQGRNNGVHSIQFLVKSQCDTYNSLQKTRAQVRNAEHIIGSDRAFFWGDWP